MKLTLHTLQGEELFECNVDVSSSQDWSLMADNKLSITFQLEHCVNLTPGSYVDYDGVRFYLLKEFKPTEIDSATWSYNLTLFDAASWMSVTVPVNLLDGKNNPTFIYTASLREHASIIVANLNRRMNTDQWKVGNIIDSSNITVKYDGRYCSAILQELVDDQDAEWWVDGMTLNIGRAEFGEAVELGYGNGLLGNIVCDQADNMRSYAYLYPLGSTRNIDPTKYGYERLQLPNGQMYVDMSETGIAELVEERAFAGIFPRYEGAVTSVRSRAATSDNGEEFIIYYISDSDIPFNPNNYKMPGLVPNITFLSGELMGQDFEVNYDADAHEFEIITRWTSDNVTQLPGGLLTPAVGDEYVVWNITMPDEYYPMAEREFLEAAQKFADNSEKDISIYKANLDYIEVQERGLQLRPGQRVRLISSEYFPDKGYYDSRITRMTRKLWYPDEVTIDVSAVRVIGSLSRIESSLSKAESRVSQLSVSIPAIIKSTDNSLPTDSSVYTSLRIDREYLSRRKGGVMDGPLFIGNTLSSASWTGSKGFAFSKLPDGVSYRGDIDEFHAKELFAETFYIAGIPFRKTANGSLFIDANVVFGGGVTMYGTDSTPAPSIFDGLPIDNQTLQWQETENGKILVAVGGGSGGGGVADSVAWANVVGKPTWITNSKPTYNYSEIQGTPDLSVYALASAIPTNNNQLTNGAGYITASALIGYATQTFVNTAINGAKEWVEEQQYLTEITSGMIESVLGYQPYDGDTNRLGFLTSSALNGYATQSWVNTALAGYLPLSGGAINGNLNIGSADNNNYYYLKFSRYNHALRINNTDAGGYISFGDNTNGSFTVEKTLEIGDKGFRYSSDGGNTYKDILHSGNYSDYTFGWESAYSKDLNGVYNAILSGGSFLNAPNGLQYGALLTLPYRKVTGNQNQDFATQIYVPNGDYNGCAIYWRGALSNQWQAWRVLLDSSNYSNYALPKDGTAASATKLATPRTIWGKSFDGTGNVTGDMSGVGKFSANDNGYLTDISNGDIAISLPVRVTGGWEKGLEYKHLSNEAAFGYLAGAYGVGTTLSYYFYGGGYGTGSHAMRLYDANNNYKAVFNGNVTAPTFTGNLVGNADSATKLATPRTIWGHSFDGTGDVSGAFNNILNAYRGSSTTAYLHITNVYADVDYISMYVSNLDNSRTDRPLVLQNGYGNVGIGGTTASEKLHVHGNTQITGNLIFDTESETLILRKLNSTGKTAIFTQVNSSDHLLIGQGIAKAGKNTYIYGNEMIFAYGTAGSSSSAAMHIYSNGNVSIGGTTANAKLHVYGNLLTEGGITMYSQRSLKNILSYDGLSLEQLSVIKPIKFTWKDGRDNRYHVGGVADDMATVVPEVVYSANDFLTMDYGNAGFYVAASLIKPVLDHEQRIKILEQENKALRKEINQLKQAS